MKYNVLKQLIQKYKEINSQKESNILLNIIDQYN